MKRSATACLLALIALVLVARPALAQQDTPPESQDAPPAEKVFRTFDQPVGAFQLQERGGQFLRDRDLLGKIWVAQFFYPGCNLCSRNTPTMKSLQDNYRGKSDIRLVSIALNNDSLATLQEFAKDHNAEPDQWLFLTGPQEKVHDIVRLGFFNMTFPKQNPALGDEIAHSTYLVLVDPHGSMVGYVDGTQAKADVALQEQIDLLRMRRRLEQPIPVTGAALPQFNALLNSSCTVLLLLGWIAIRLRWVTLHKVLMLLALNVSILFLASYLYYHFVVLEAEPMRFRGEGSMRYVYFTILLTHTILAMAVAPLAMYITVQGLRNALPQHVRVARWTLPIWLYVSVTGVVVYWMLYRMEW